MGSTSRHKNVNIHSLKYDSAKVIVFRAAMSRYHIHSAKRLVA